MAGRSRSHRRDTVARGQPEMSPAISWVMFVRIKVTTTATDLTARSPRGLPAGFDHVPGRGPGAPGQRLGGGPLTVVSRYELSLVAAPSRGVL